MKMSVMVPTSAISRHLYTENRKIYHYIMWLGDVNFFFCTLFWKNSHVTVIKGFFQNLNRHEFF